MYRLTEISPAASGERLLLRLVSDDGEAVTVNISCGTYARLGLKKGELDGRVAAKLIDEANFEKAVLKGLSILGYGSNSAKRMKSKLREKGFSEAVSDKAVSYLVNHGYIDESKDAVRLCESMIKKKYGAKRIISALRSKGYGDSAVSAASEYLEGVDFISLCAALIRIKFKQLPADRAEMQKAIAKLVALGYNVSDVKAAFRLLSEG